MTPTYDNMSREERRTLHGVVISVIAGQLLAPFMHSGVAVMLPSIGRELHASGAQLGLVGTVYCLALAIFHLVMGRAGDKWGRKRVCLCGMLLLTSAVTATVFCPGIETVIGLRFLQGMGTATVNTCALTMMVACSPPNLRGRIFGLTMTSVYLGLAVGPVVGGYMDTTFGWRSLFGVLGGVGAFSCIVMSVFVRREWKEKPEAPYDWAGLCLFAGGMTAFVMGTVGPVPPAVAPFCAGAGLLGIVLFGMHQTRLTSTEPLLDVKHLLHNRVFVLSNIASLAMFSSLFAITFFFSLYLQYVKGYSARDAGFVLFAEPLAGLFSLSGTTHEMCVACMRTVSLGFLPAGLCIAFQGVFQALGRGVESLIISVFRQVLLVLPPVWALSQLVTGAENVSLVWWPLALGEAATLAVALVLYLVNGRKLVRSL